jgi:hypothetical protein
MNNIKELMDKRCPVPGTGLISPEAEVLLGEKEVCIDGYGISLERTLPGDYGGKSKGLTLDSK